MTTLQIRLAVEFLKEIIAYGKDENILDDRTGTVSKSGTALRLMQIGLTIIKYHKLDNANPEDFKKQVEDLTKKRTLNAEIEWLKILPDEKLKFLQTKIKERRDELYREFVDKL